MQRYVHIVVSVLLFVIMGFGYHTFTAAQDTAAQEAPPFEFRSLNDEAYQVLIQFYGYDQHYPLQAKVVQIIEHDTAILEKIVFNGTRDSRVPGYLVIPKAGEAPYPCVMLLHWLSGSKESWIHTDNFASSDRLVKELLAAGFAIIALDAQYHGERSVENDYENAGRLVEKEYYERYREMLIESVIDYRRAIDYLETRPEIDVNRIGVIGYSMGGNMTFVLTGVESRIKAAVACVAPIFQYQVGAYCPHNFAEAIGERPFLMLMGRKDEYYTEEDARHVFDLIPGATKDLVFYDSGHVLPPEFTTKAVNWHKEHLK
jgi:dienelactone hydrolase